MKKFYILLISIFALTSSCTSDSESTTQPDPNLLQRVDFNPNTINEKRWLFDADGLLIEITKANGNVIQNFNYDSRNRLISSTIYNDSGSNETHTFTYSNTDFVTSVDGVTLNYDATLGAYYTGDLNQSYVLTKINNDRLLVYSKTAFMDEIDLGVFEEIIGNELTVEFTNSNILGYFPNEQCNFLSYDNKTNPLKNATLAICRAFSFVPESRWVFDYCVSANNVMTHRYCLEDPESYVYHYIYNSNNLPQTQTSDSYYLGVYENTVTSINYYYQGDALP